MKFEYLEGKEAGALALKMHRVMPKGISNRVTLGALGGLVAAVLSDLVAEVGEDALMEVLEDWTVEIAAKAMLIAKLQKEDFDFAACAAEHFPTVGEA